MSSFPLSASNFPVCFADASWSLAWWLSFDVLSLTKIVNDALILQRRYIGQFCVGLISERLPVGNQNIGVELFSADWRTTLLGTAGQLAVFESSSVNWLIVVDRKMRSRSRDQCSEQRKKEFLRTSKRNRIFYFNLGLSSVGRNLSWI